jgi:hypothetical protein
MIEWVETRTLHHVPRDRGQLLCSSIDPIAESKKWFEKSFDKSNERYEAIFILGLAGGFHVAQVAGAFPDAEIIVVESNFELGDELQSRRGPISDNVTLLAGLKFDEIKKNIFIKSGIKSLYKVVCYPTSYRLDKTYYEKVNSFLLGRTSDAFALHLQARRDQKHFFESLLEYDVDLFKNNITVLDIERAVRARNKPLEYEGMVWMALRELVK